MTTEELKSKALDDFRAQYPTVTNADLQTFILGMNAGITIGILIVNCDIKK